MATTKIRSSSITDGQVSNADLSATVAVTGGQIADDAVTLAKMAGLARGKIIVGDASGDPSALTVGSVNQVLKSDGTDVSWGADSGGLFSSYAILADQKSSGTGGGQCTSGAWRLHDLQTTITDPDSIVTSLSSSVFTLAAGNYLIRWTTTGYSSHYQSNRLSENGGSVMGTGGTGRTANADEPNVQMIGMARVTPVSSTGYIIEQRANTSNASGFGNPGSLQTETYAWVEIYKES